MDWSESELHTPRWHLEVEGHLINRLAFGSKAFPVVTVQSAETIYDRIDYSLHDPATGEVIKEGVARDLEGLLERGKRWWVFRV